MHNCVCSQLRVSADVQCEASYYNEKLSVWEPLLEPLEDAKTSRLLPWCLNVQVREATPTGIQSHTHSQQFDGGIHM